MQDENAEFEGKITAKSRAIAKQREEYMSAQSKLSEFQDEVEVMRNTLQKAASDVVVLRSTSASLTAAVDEKRLALEAARARYAAAQAKLDAAAKMVDKVRLMRRTG